MKCSKCGNEILDDAKFCPKCGTKLNDNLDIQVELAQQHLKEASTNIAAAVKEIAALPNIDVKVTAVLNTVGLAIFFFPWAGMLGFSASGFSIATNPKLFGFMVIVYYYFRLLVLLLYIHTIDLISLLSTF